ncbi:MAG: hypothetical protein LBU46_04465, partial [Candidatus Accumulibacter sp.]|nr:hypothetical protein [Accumulibacter sp.]
MSLTLLLAKRIPSALGAGNNFWGSKGAKERSPIGQGRGQYPAREAKFIRSSSTTNKGGSPRSLDKRSA